MDHSVRVFKYPDTGPTEAGGARLPAGGQVLPREPHRADRRQQQDQPHQDLQPGQGRHEGRGAAAGAHGLTEAPHAVLHRAGVRTGMHALISHHHSSVAL